MIGQKWKRYSKVYLLLAIVIAVAGTFSYRHFGMQSAEESAQRCIMSGTVVEEDGTVTEPTSPEMVCFDNRVDALIYLTDGKVTSLPEDTEEAYHEALQNYYAEISAAYQATQTAQD